MSQAKELIIKFKSNKKKMIRFKIQDPFILYFKFGF